MKPILGPGDFYGNRQRRYEIPVARFTEMAYVPSFEIPRHAHERAFFGFILEGGYAETYERRSRECGPSTLLFHPEGESHSETHYDVTVRIFSIEPEPDLLERVRMRPDMLHSPLEFQGGPAAHLMVRLYREFREPDDLSPLSLEGLLLELLAVTGRAGSSSGDTRPPRWLQQTQDLLTERFAEPLSLQELAEAAGVHPTHLARSFRQHYRCTVGDYVRSLRIEQACHALATTSAPLCDIALNAGYSDQSHFASAFKRQTGITPGQYRKLSPPR